MSERRAGAKGRRLGSSRRKQLHEGSRETPAPVPSAAEEPPWASEIVQRAQHLLRDRDTAQAGVITRSDVQKLQEEGLPCSREELELVFDGLDAAGTGRLGTEEFTAGLRQFLSSQNAAREHRRRKTASRRVRLLLPAPALEGVDSEERRHFAAFMEQLGTEKLSEEQEIWQLWVKLRQDEPQLLDNLEDFLAKMRHRIQEARSEKEALELTLNKRVAEHDKDVQQLCEVLEQQIQQEQLRLQQQSMARSHQQGEELQRVLDASEREVQRLVTAQMELERRCQSLHSSQQATSTENQQLQESNRALQQHLQHLHQQLQQTQGHLRTMRATVVWEPGDRVVAELPIEVPMSPQSPGKFRSEMRIRLGSQSDESKAKSTHQVVWEVLPAEINLSGAPQKASSAEEDPFPEPVKEEGVSDQSSLLREMNDAIAALSKHLKAQGAPPALADIPWDNAEPQTGPEAATAHGTTPGVLQETLPGHIHHELLEGDLQEGPGRAELRAPDVTQAGASTGAGHCTAQEPGAEQGESPEEAKRMLFLQGKGAGVEEMVLNVPEHLGESTEAREQEMEGARWMQEKTGWAKPQLLGEAEKVETSQGENLEAGLGPPEAGQGGVAVGQCLAMDELQPGGTLGEHVQEWAELALGHPEKLETELGQHLEPEPPSWGEAQAEAAHGDGVPEVTVAPGPGELDEERARTEVQPQGQTMDSKVLEVLPAPAERAGSSRAGAEEEEVEEAEPREAEQQLQGECGRGGAGQGGSAGAQEPLAAAVPPTHGQEGGVGTDVELMETQSSTNKELLAELEADLQVWNEAGSPGTHQGGGVDPGVQLEEDKPGLGEELGAAAGHREGPAPAETPVGSPDLCGLLPVESQALEMVEADLQLCGDLSPETPQGGEGGAVQIEEEEDGAQEEGEHGLPQEPVPHPSGVSSEQGEGAGEGVQSWEEAESLDNTGEQSSGANVQLIAEGGELRLTPGGSTEADLQLVGEPGSPGTEQGGRLDPDVHPQDQVDKEEVLEMEVDDAQSDLQLCGGLSPEKPWGGESGTAVQMEEEEDGAEGQGEHGLPHEAEPQSNGETSGQGEEPGAGLQSGEEVGSLDNTGEQSSGANVQLIAEGGELRLTPGGSTEADLQPVGEPGYPGTEQGGRLDSEVHSLDQVNRAESVEGEAEDAQEDMQISESLSSGVPWGGETGTDVQVEEEEDGAQGQGEGELPHEPVLDLQGSGLRQGEGAGEDLQAQEEAESLDTVEDQSSGANVQLIAEGGELRLTPGGSTEADLQLVGEPGSPGTEQGGRLDPDVHPQDQADTEDILESEVDDAQSDLQLCGGLSPGAPWGGESGTAVQMEEEEDGAEGQGEHGLPHKAEPQSNGETLGQGEEPGAVLQSWEEVESLDNTGEQSSGANVQLIAEGGELRLTPGGSTEADLQLVGEVGSSGTEQGGRLDPDVQPLDEVDKEEVLEMEVDDAQSDLQLCGDLSPEKPWGRESGTAVQMEEEEDGAEGQGEHGLPHEAESQFNAVTLGQGEEPGADVQPWEKAEGLDTVEDQSSGVSVQLIAEGDELKSASGESTEADLQPLIKTDSLGTEQGGRLDPDVHPLDQEDKAEVLEMEAEGVQGDLMFHEGLSPGAPWGGEGGRAIQIEEDEEDGAQGQGEHGLPQASVLDPQGAQGRQGQGAGAGVQPEEEAESLGTLEAQSTAADVQLFTEQQEPKSGSGGSTEADLTPLGAAGMWEGEQSLSPGLEAGLGASPTANPWEGAAAAHVPSPTEAALCPEPVTAAEGPGLEAKLGACIDPEGQILEAQELLQGQRAPAEGKPLDGAHGLEVAQGERLEAGVRNGVETQGLGLKQGHDDAVPALASPASELQSQTSPLKLETMMQEGVLIPDVWRLCAPGQAAQRELQEQVSAQGHEGRLHTVTPPATEPEHAAARPAEPPKQEVPPASTLHTTVRPEDAGSDQLGMVLSDDSLGKRQLLGEQSKDLSVGQQEKMQEFGQKMSPEGEPSPGQPGAVTAGGAGAAPGGCPKAPQGPEHLYNVLFVGDSHVGKTSFLYRLHADTFNPHLTATVGLDYQIKNLIVDNKRFALRLWDSAGQERYRSMTKQFFRKADGVVLMYDITSQYSFSDVRYWLSCIQEGAEDGVAVLLLGNKTDCAAQRQVPTREGECLAKEHQLMFYECSAASGHNVLESMVSFIRLLKVREDELKNKVEEVPKASQKKKGCCW